ncbi:MAG: branched-chain amino acid aminotransferase [Chitinivibrionales bacterium]
MAAALDWKNLEFAYMDTGAYVTVTYRDDSWGAIKTESKAHIPLHIAATALHYGQACFEGMKAFRQKDGSVAIFRPEENARRLINTAERLVMKAPSVDLFIDAVKKAVEINTDFVPPYGTGASLYIRPLLIGISPQVGIHASEEYLFAVLAMPVGPYYKDGFFPVDAMVQEIYDRAAPRGVGHVKAAGNYAAGMRGDMDAKSKGFPICLYLDAATHTYVEEFGTSNFIGITGDKKYITPDSQSILPSITNQSLQVIAQDLGFSVERRRIPVDSLDQFSEVGACGTAAVITPVHSIRHDRKVYTFGSADKAGENLTRFFHEIQGIQYGEIEDRHGWMVKV